MARPLKPTFDEEEVKSFIRPMLAHTKRMIVQDDQSDDRKIVTKEVYTSETNHLIDMLEAEPFVLRFAHSDEPPSFTEKGEDPFISIRPEATLLALALHWNNLNAVINSRPKGDGAPEKNISPRLMEFHRAFFPVMSIYGAYISRNESESLLSRQFVKEIKSLLAQGLDEFRQGIKSSNMKNEVKRLQSRINHNRQNQLKYLDSLIECYGTLFAVHLDLGYQVKFDYRFMRTITYERAKKDFSKFMQERRHNPLWKDDLAGFIWKLEDGFERRYHYQVILIYKGESIDSHLHDKEVLQERWIKETTGGDGACYQAWDVAKETPLGAELDGLIDSKGSPNYTALTRFVKYLNKLDLIINLNVPKGANVYGRGHAPRKILN